MNISDAPDVLTVSEAKSIARVGRNQLYEAIRRGDLYAARIGRSLRIPRVELERYLGLRTDEAGGRREPA
jgi:excisionase family DNA binding protein